MRILVVFTGGTICSSAAEDGYFSPDVNKCCMLLEMYKRIENDDVEFESAEPYTTLSENLNGSHIRLLIEFLKSMINSDYDGIIVTHGTDTLQYTASALSYAFGLNSIPIMVVSSNYILEDPRANGMDNFCSAVKFIKNRLGKGIFVPYRNDQNGVMIHRGSRLLPHQPYSHELYSIKDSYYGILKNTGYFSNDEYSESTDEIKTLDWNWDGGCSNVLFVYPYVGMTYPDIDENVKAVVFGSYHSGTLCTKSERLEQLSNLAKERNIPLFMSGAKSGAAYESVKELKSYGITVLPQASPISMYIKAAMLASEQRDIGKEILESLGGDIMYM